MKGTLLLSSLLRGGESFLRTNRFSASQEIPRAFHGTRSFITAFTNARHLSVHYHSITQLVTWVQIRNEDIHKFSTNILEWL